MRPPTYTQRADRLAAQVINFFRHNADEELMLDDIQEKFSATRGNIHTLLKPAVEAGLLFRGQDAGGEWVYAKGAKLQANLNAMPEPVQRAIAAPKGHASPRHSIDIDALKVEDGIPVAMTNGNAPGVSKWDPLFAKLTKAGQSVAVPGHVKGAIAAAIARRKKDKAPGNYCVAMTGNGEARVWKTA
jgi:hypothetical protein